MGLLRSTWEQRPVPERSAGLQSLHGLDHETMVRVFGWDPEVEGY